MEWATSFKVTFVSLVSSFLSDSDEPVSSFAHPASADAARAATRSADKSFYFIITSTKLFHTIRLCTPTKGVKAASHSVFIRILLKFGQFFFYALYFSTNH